MNKPSNVRAKCVHLSVCILASGRQALPGIPYGPARAAVILFLVIRLNSSGTQEQFYDEDGKILTNSIAMHEDKVINGVVQRITVRGKDMNNPVLLRVHGGPGSFFTPFTYRRLARDLEEILTVCYWDQRGSGPASTREIPMETINLEQIVEDGLEVTKFLKEKF